MIAHGIHQAAAQFRIAIIELTVGGGQFAEHAAVKGVAFVGPVKPHGQHVPASLGDDPIGIHNSFASSIFRSCSCQPCGVYRHAAICSTPRTDSGDLSDAAASVRARRAPLNCGNRAGPGKVTNTLPTGAPHDRRFCAGVAVAQLPVLARSTAHSLPRLPADAAAAECVFDNWTRPASSRSAWICARCSSSMASRRGITGVSAALDTGVIGRRKSDMRGRQGRGRRDANHRGARPTGGSTPVCSATPPGAAEGEVCLHAIPITPATGAEHPTGLAAARRPPPARETDQGVAGTHRAANQRRWPDPPSAAPHPPPAASCARSHTERH